MMHAQVFTKKKAEKKNVSRRVPRIRGNGS